MALDKITTDIIADDAVTAAKIVAGAVDADIRDGAVTPSKIPYFENATNTQNLSGTYSTERMYLNDSYTLTGDVTVTGHLALGTLAGADVVITQDSTERTLTGSGTLEAGNVLQDTHRTDLTSMTGELGSAVTGSPALNLGNTTGVLPAGITGGSGLDIITVTDQWFINATRTSGTINGNWVRPSIGGDFSTAWSNKGGGINGPNASGHFSFSVTGLYLIYMNVIIREAGGGADANSGICLYVSINNGSNFYKTIIARTHASTSPSGANTSASNMGFINVNAVTGGSTVKFLIATDSLAGSNQIYGDTSTINTGFSIIRLGSNT